MRTYKALIWRIFTPSMVVAFGLTTLVAGFSGGTGTSADPYQIATVQDLLAMNADPNLASKCFALVNDIDANDYPEAFQDAVVIQAFQGIFDGRHHTIANIDIRDRNSSWNGPMGFFSAIGLDGIVRDLTLENAIVYSPVFPLPKGGLLTGDNQGTVSGCRVSGLAGGFETIGGMVGYNNGGTLESCSSVITLSGGRGINYMGGLVGVDVNGLISDCRVSGTLYTGDLNSDYHEYSAGGLIGQSSQGTIRHCSTIVDVNGLSSHPLIKDSPHLGGLIGINDSEVTDCQVTCNIWGKSGLGGLIGMNEGRVSRCSVSGNIQGTTVIGGLIGGNSGYVECCYAYAYMESKEDAVGGLIGANSGIVAQCYSRSQIHAISRGGGLIGSNGIAGLVLNCYCDDDVFLVESDVGDPSIGGMIGLNRGTARQCYTSSRLHVMKETMYLGGFIGGDMRWPATSFCYYLGDSQDANVPFDSKLPAQALDSQQMTVNTNFKGFDFFGSARDGAQDVWFMPEDGFPILSWQTEETGLAVIPNINGQSVERARSALEEAGFTIGAITCDYSADVASGLGLFSLPAYVAPVGSTVDLIMSLGPYDWTGNPGNGSLEMPFEITTPGQLECLGSDSSLWEKCFVLAADLDMLGRTYNTALIAADQNDIQEGFQGKGFTGLLDGQQHTISNFHIDTVGQIHDYLGLFGMIGNPAAVVSEVAGLYDVSLYGGPSTVSNITIRDTRVLGQFAGIDEACTTIGPVAGENAGTISNCHVNGKIYGTDVIFGDIVPCGDLCRYFNNGTNIGGVVGKNAGLVDGCTFKGAVSGQRAVGGIAGGMASDQAVCAIVDCYAQSEVSGCTNLGGIVGLVQQGYVLRCSTDVTLSGEGGGLIGSCHLGVVSECYARGIVRSKHDGAGLVGFNGDIEYPLADGGLISNCYTSVSVIAEHEGAGLVLSSNGLIRNCYATGTVETGENGAALVLNADYVEESYFLISDATNALQTDIGTGLTDEEMKHQENFIGWDFTREWRNGTDEIWFMPENDYPKLWWQAAE